MDIISLIGNLCGIASLILTVAFRIQDQKMK